MSDRKLTTPGARQIGAKANDSELQEMIVLGRLAVYPGYVVKVRDGFCIPLNESQPHRLFVALAQGARRNQPCMSRYLYDVLWPGTMPENPAKALSNVARRLRAWLKQTHLDEYVVLPEGGHSTYQYYLMLRNEGQ